MEATQTHGRWRRIMRTRKTRRAAVKSVLMAAGKAAMPVILPRASMNSARASTITLHFDTSAGNLPSYDPDASKLEVIANAAKAVWLKLLPENGHDYAVNVHYGPLG